LRVRGSASAWLLAAITILGFGLRLWSLDYGLPGVFNMDERPILDRALTFAKGDPNPHNFLYPTLYLYALFAWEALFFVVGRLVGAFGSLADFQNAFFVDPSMHVLAGRALTVAFGTLTIPATYLFGARLYGRAAGLAAALFMAAAPLAVRDAHYIKLDVPTTLFVALAHAGLAAIVVDDSWARRRRSWMLAGAAAGLAISTQYYAGILAVPFVAVAIADMRRSGRPLTSLRLLSWAGIATIAAFAATSPFFVLEPSVIVRDFRELRAVDIDRAVGIGMFSSFWPYARLLATGASGFPVFWLATAGSLIALITAWRRGILLVALPVAFMLFLSNTFPASRYLNIMLPCIAVAAGYAVSFIGSRLPTRLLPATAALAVAAAIPAAADSVRWDRFFATDDTRTEAARFIEREVPPGATILVQPYSAPIRQSREGLAEALRAKLGDEAEAPLKYKLQLAATPYPSPSYRILYLGESGKTGAPPADVDKIYLAPSSITPEQGLRQLREAGVQYVVLTRYGQPLPTFRNLEAALDRDAHRIATFSPYRDGRDPSDAPVPPFRHNGNTWIHPLLERPGPFVEIWRVDKLN